MSDDALEPVAGPPTMSLMDAILEGDEERSELDKIFEQFLDPANIAHNTDFAAREIAAFSAAAVMADKYNLDSAKRFLIESKINRVSKGRAGRKEWVKIITRQQEREEQRMGFGARLMGRNAPNDRSRYP